jgi:hypothetical protein
MKKILSLILAFSFLQVSIAVAPSADGAKPLNANQIMIPIGKTGQKISLADFSKLTPNEYEKLAHVKLNLFDRVNYKLGMRKLKHSIAADGTIKNKKLSEAMGSDLTSGFHIGGFALGVLLSLIGVLIAYLINDDKKSARVKWAWIGFAVWVVLVILFSL